VEDGAGTTVFLSYAHRDAAALASTIRDYLVRAGLSVWHDVTRIRAGHSWTVEIQDGLRTADVVVALLSPGAVRRSSDGDDDLDSVCLDEIEYAIDACRIPVVPVLAVTCEPPFRIFRLQYLDFRSWSDPTRPDGQLLERLRLAVDTAATTRHSPVRRWGPLPEPWDFGPFLTERRAGFVGREWLLSDITAWLREERGGSLLIVGGPGTGKSAVVAHLVHENLDGHVLAYHCCQADTPLTLDAGRFVQSLAGQLSARLEGFAEAMTTATQLDLLAAAGQDPGSAFEAAILAPLASLPGPRSGGRFLVVDALDESLDARATTIAELLATRLQRFPRWLRVVATTRPVKRILARFGEATVLSLDGLEPRNQNDVRRFVEGRLDSPDLASMVRSSGLARSDVLASLLDACAGNFLFARQTLEALAGGQLSIAEVGELPPGLGALYGIFLDRLFGRDGTDFAAARVVLEALMASQAPPSRRELAAVTGLDSGDELVRILAGLGSLLVVQDGRYRVFHKSFTDWLTAWDKDLDQPEAGHYHISLRQAHERWAGHLFDKYNRGSNTVSVLRLLPTHLAGAHRWDDLCAVLLDGTFLAAVANGDATTVLDVRRHLALAMDCLPTSHPNRDLLIALDGVIALDTDFVVKHPEALFQCCWNRMLGSSELEAFARRWRDARTAAGAFPWLELMHPVLSGPGSPLARIIRASPTGVHALAAVPNTDHIVAGTGDGIVSVWDVRMGAIVAQLGAHPKGVTAVSSAGEHAITGAEDGEIVVWDLSSGTSSGVLHGHTRRVDAVAMTGDGRVAFSAARDWTVRAWDVDRLTQLGEVAVNRWSWTTALLLDRDGETVLFAESFVVQSSSLGGPTRSELWKWSPGSERSRVVSFSEAAFDLAWLPERIHVGSFSEAAVDLAWLPDGRILIATSSGTTSSITESQSFMLILDPATGEVETLSSWRGHRNYPRVLTVYGDAHALVGLGSGGLRFFTPDRREDLGAVLVHGDAVTALCTAAGGNFTVTGSADGNIKVWRTAALLASHDEPTDGARDALQSDVLDLVLFDAGLRIIAVRRDGTGEVWQIDPPVLLRSFAYFAPDETVTVARASLVDGGRVVDYLALDHIYLAPIEETGRFEVNLPEPISPPGAPDGRTTGLRVQLDDGDVVVSRDSRGASPVRYRADSPLTRVVAAGDNIVCGDAQGQIHFLRAAHA
jgi:WD40 repeat protein